MTTKEKLLELLLKDSECNSEHDTANEVASCYICRGNFIIKSCIEVLKDKVVLKEDLLTVDEVLLTIKLAKDKWYSEHSHDMSASYNFVANEVVEAQQRKANREKV
jgi:hypothetical protein